MPRMRAVLSCMRALENRGSPSSRCSRVRQLAPLAWWLDLFAAPASSTQGERAPQPAYSPLVLALRECCRGGVSSGCAADRGGRAVLFSRKHFWALRTTIYPYKAEVVSLVGLRPIGRVFNTTYCDACTIGNFYFCEFRTILRFLRCREQTLRQAPTYLAALQKLCCTKPRAAIATLWGFDAACQGAPRLSPAQMVAGFGRMSDLDCSAGDILGRDDGLEGCGVPLMRGDACASAQTGIAGGAPTLSHVRVGWIVGW